MSVGSDEDKTTEERLQILVGCCRAVVKNRFWAVVKSYIRYKYTKEPSYWFLPRSFGPPSDLAGKQGKYNQAFQSTKSGEKNLTLIVAFWQLEATPAYPPSNSVVLLKFCAEKPTFATPFSQSY